MIGDLLRIPAATMDALTEHLLQDDGLERVAVCELVDSRGDLVVVDTELVVDDDLKYLTHGDCELTKSKKRDVFDRCNLQDRYPLFLHSHPFTNPAWFSNCDLETMENTVEWAHGLHDCRLFYGVLSQQQLRIEEVTKEYTRRPVPTTIVGDWTLTAGTDCDETVTPDDGEDYTPELVYQPRRSVSVDDAFWELFDRTCRVYGDDAMTRLAGTHVAVVGCGGIGSDIIECLAGVGIRRVTFIDPDRIERSNLPRLPQADLGSDDRYKAAVMQEWYHSQVPDAETTVVTTPVQEAVDALRDVDIIVGAVDRVTPRVWLNEYAVQHLVPYIDTGCVFHADESDADEDSGVFDIEEKRLQVQVIAPGTDQGCLECIGRVDEAEMRREQAPEAVLEKEVERGYIPEAAVTPAAAVTTVNKIAAAHAVDQLVRIVTRYAPPADTLQYDLVDYTADHVHTHRSNACYTCQRFLATGDAGPSSDHADAAVQERDLATEFEQVTRRDSERSDTTPDSTDNNTVRAFPAAVTAFFTTDPTASNTD